MAHDHNQQTAGSARAARSDQTPRDPSAEIKPPKNPDEVLGVIEGVERQLESLRRAHEEHRELAAELATRRAKLDEMNDRLEQRESEISEHEVEVAQMREQLEERESDLVQRASGLETRESQLADQASKIEELEAQLETRSREIDERVAELDQQLEGISQRKDELAKLEAEARAKLEKDSELAARITQLEQDLQKAKASVSGKEIELRDRARAVEELAVRAGALENQIQEMSERAQQEREALTAQTQAVQTKLDEATALIESRDEALSRAMERIETLETGAKDFAQREQTLREELAHASRAIETAADRTELDNALALAQEAQRKAETLEQELESRRAASKEELENALGTIESLESQLERANAQLKDAKAGGSALEADAKEARATIESLTKQLEQTKQSADRAIAERDALAKALEESRAQTDATSAEISTKLDEATVRIAALEQDIAQRTKELERVGAELSMAQTHTRSLEAQIEELEARPQGVSDEFVTIRRERLANIKAALKSRANKVRLATEALSDRYEQCEAVLQKRAELVEAYNAVAEGEKKLARREARSGALIGLGAFGLVLALLAGISWFVSGQVAPGVYASSITLTADAGERSLTPSDLSGWQTYVTELVQDPQFHEQASQRMKQRGIAELAVPGELGSYLRDSLDIMTPEPGSVQMELRGEGAARTQRVLDTLALTLTSQANASRARRTDGALTRIDQTATEGGAPLDTKRIEMASMIFGGSSVASFLIGGIFLRRLSAMKAKFERDTRVQPLFDEDSWTVNEA
jgi:predicted  nucleic acid-binding Zn-ribbon protein